MKKGSRKRKAQRVKSLKARRKAAATKVVAKAAKHAERAITGLLKAMALIAMATRRG